MPLSNSSQILINNLAYKNKMTSSLLMETSYIPWHMVKKIFQFLPLPYNNSVDLKIYVYHSLHFNLSQCWQHSFLCFLSLMIKTHKKQLGGFPQPEIPPCQNTNTYKKPHHTDAHSSIQHLLNPLLKYFSAASP